MTIIDELRARKGYISTSELMGTLGVCRRTLLRWTNSGRLHSIRMGNANRYDPAHVVAFLEARSQGQDD